MSERTDSPSFSAEMISRVVHANGITEEAYSDGSRRFAGPNWREDGILWIERDGGAILLPPSKNNISARTKLWVEVAKMMPSQKEIVFDDLQNYKAEAVGLLEALRYAVETGKPQFFRDLANAIKPMESLEVRKAKGRSEAALKDDPVHESIMQAAQEVSGIPAFELIVKHYRTTAHNAGETAQHVREKIESRGYGWFLLASQ
jgi:hypothetical protein